MAGVGNRDRFHRMPGKHGSGDQKIPCRWVKQNRIQRIRAEYSLTVATMVVPCCSGLMRIVERAVELSGTKINVKKMVVGIDGEVQP
jgi:hypothetical protein